MKLSLDAFRGATQPVEFDFGKSKIVILYGENGCGKTTLVDAFDVLANDTMGSLQDKSVGAKARFLTSAQRDSDDLSIELTIGKDTWSAKKSGSRIIKSPDHNLPSVMLLRRQKVTDLVEEADANKYRRISAFIEVPELQANEDALASLVSNYKMKLKPITGQITYAQETLTGQWDSADLAERGKSSPMEWAQSEAGKLKTGWQDTPHPSADLATATDTCSRKVSSFVDASTALASAETDLTNTTIAYEEAAASNSTESADALNLLQETRDYLSKTNSDDLTECPVCEQGLSGKDLESRISRRLDSLSAVIEKQTSLKSAQQKQEITSKQFATSKESLTTAVTAFTTTHSNSGSKASLPDFGPLHSFISDSHENYDPASLIKALDQIYTDLRSEIRNSGAINQQRQNLAEQLKQKSEAENELRKVERQLELATKCLEIVRDTRKTYIDSILLNISRDVATLYSAIHPDEDLDNIQLLLNPNKNASLEIKGTAYGQENVVPQGYYSESHLDTLGICIFLALARRGDSENTILIVDDAVTSVDERHLERLVQLFYDQADHFSRIILTSHYRPWREKYRWGHLRHANCTFIELRDWCPEKGLQYTKADRLPVDRVRQLVEDPEATPGEAVALAGVLLECLLDFLSITYQCKLARKPMGVGWTIGELFGSLNAKLKKALRIEIVDSEGSVVEIREVAELLKAIQDLCGLRNCLGCHYNELGAQFPAKDAKAFVGSILELADALCDENGALPASKKSGSYWETPDKSRRLHPLQQPG